MANLYHQDVLVGDIDKRLRSSAGRFTVTCGPGEFQVVPGQTRIRIDGVCWTMCENYDIYVDVKWCSVSTGRYVCTVWKGGIDDCAHFEVVDHATDGRIPEGYVGAPYVQQHEVLLLL